MAINLSKGSRINLSKENPLLKRIRAGLGWRPNGTDTGKAFDLDVSIFGLVQKGEAGKLKNEDYFVFYNSETRTNDKQSTFKQDATEFPKKGMPASPCLGIVHSGDNTTGAGEGDDETVFVDLTKIDPEISEISFIVTIHEAEARRQNFGQVDGSVIRLYNDETGAVLAEYKLEDDFSSETALQFGSLYKKDGQWLFKAVGAGYNKGLGDFVNLYQ